ncbi:MAG TPA: SurA N-terminal domain-containing protein [Dehalococcoidia bacterium]|nr:SurA N-terminal domain-containing protein [Dehalococcoidia bacterium]
MSRRSERTTGLPKARRREGPASGGRGPFQNLRNNDRVIHYAIVSAAALLLATVLIITGAGWYHDNWGHGREVVLRVGEEKFTLSYFSDRLVDYSIENPTRTLSFQTGLMSQLEREGLAVELARESGLALSDEAIEQRIADDLGISAGGGAFDSALRTELRSTGMSLGTYTRKIEALAVEDALLEQIGADIETTADLITLRVVVLSDADTAASVIERIEGGEDMGTIAQTESIDLVSRTQDGIRDATPEAFLADGIGEAVTGQEIGTLLGPVEVNTTEFWVIRVEERAEGELTEAQQLQLGLEALNEALAEKRARTTILRSADAGDFEWAANKAGF